jgi:hypothetical protein
MQEYGFYYIDKHSFPEAQKVTKNKINDHEKNRIPSNRRSIDLAAQRLL